MIATLIHKAFSDEPKTVAKIDVGTLTGIEALEYVYRITQNINGSWSKGEFFDDGTQNHDYNQDIRVVADLDVIDGITYGLRSTSMGDVVELQGQRYVVAAMGFKLEAEAVEEDLF